MHKCSNCGTEFETRFCPDCGTKWLADKTCPKCKTVSKGGANFCAECGHFFEITPPLKEPVDDSFARKMLNTCRALPYILFT
ncbi:MAG: zinc ribbon domain-containing protein, partial [Clostridia bacterium]|nr:zinc ribbon domain-containing protein [Clostridia bacterium]